MLDESTSSSIRPRLGGSTEGEALTFGEATKPREQRCKEQMERGNKKI